MSPSPRHGTCASTAADLRPRPPGTDPRRAGGDPCRPPREADGPPDAADRVESLLRDLGPWLRRGAGAAAGGADRPRLATGLPELDRLLAGGFPRGRLSEIAGPVSSGRTSVAHALLARLSHSQQVGALVDAADGFDPASAAAAGTRLEQLLWVRAPGPSEALRCCERLLETDGFAAVLLDLTRPELRAAPSVWPRLARAASASQAALVVLAAQRIAGPYAELALEMRPARARFSGPPLLFEGLEIEVDLVRHRGLPGACRTSLRLRANAA